MSKTNKIFERIPVEIPDRSGFDLSHEVLTTAKTGTVVPVTYIECTPGDTISIGSAMKVTLPPFAVPFMGRIDAELTAAFIPNRLLWSGWKPFIMQNNGTLISNPAISQDGGVSQSVNVPNRVPYIDMNIEYASDPSLVGPGSLANYLGYKIPTGSSDAYGTISAMPFLAYHRFCDDWIRAEQIQKPFFPVMGPSEYGYHDEIGGSSFTGMDGGHFLPYMALPVASNPQPRVKLGPTITPSQSGSTVCDLSIGLGSLRQRCWAKDYFTTATTRPQAGPDSQVTFTVDSTTLNGGFTIASLRAANALQKWLERNNIAGTDESSFSLAHWGVVPPDHALQRSVLLGRVRTPVYVGSVENSTGTGDTTNPGTRSPYGNTLGAAAGFGSSAGKGSLVDNFTAKEHGYLMIFFTLIPHAYYNTGVSRDLLHQYVGDFAWPEFSGIGDQPIFGAELTANSSSIGYDLTWGYQQRYAEYKHMLDRVTGLVSDGNNLDVYALQRGFTSLPQLGSEFLEIPTDYLDQVSGVSSELSGFGCLLNVFIDAKALRVLPEYSIPHL